MRTFFTVLKNNYLRLLPRIMSVVVFTVFTLGSIFLAVYITKTEQVKAHIVVIAQHGSAIPQGSKALDITIRTKKPPLSDLVKQKYDAYVTINANGSYTIDTLRNERFKSMLQRLIKAPNADLSDYQTERSIGVNILGFMMMFLLMIAFFNLFAFADDKEQGQLRRIAVAPSSFGWYLAAHCIYCLSMLLPEYLLLVLLKLCGWNIGFSLLQYAGLMTALAFLGISFALLLNTLIQKPDNANMLGNSITVLTSVLSGSFYAFSKNNSVLDHMIKLIPQKDLMDFAQSLGNKTEKAHIGSMLYVVAFSLVMFVLSYTILKRMYVKKI